MFNQCISLSPQHVQNKEETVLYSLRAAVGDHVNDCRPCIWTEPHLIRVCSSVSTWFSAALRCKQRLLLGFI